MTRQIYLSMALICSIGHAQPTAAWPPGDLTLPTAQGNTEIDPSSPFLWVSGSGAWLETRQPNGQWTRQSVTGIHVDAGDNKESDPTGPRQLADLHTKLIQLDRRLRKQAGVDSDKNASWHLNLVLDRKLPYALLSRLIYTAGITRFNRLVMAVNDHRASGVLLSVPRHQLDKPGESSPRNRPLSLDFAVNGNEIRIRGQGIDVRELGPTSSCSMKAEQGFECRLGKHQIDELARLAIELKKKRPTENSFSIVLEQRAPIQDLFLFSDTIGRRGQAGQSSAGSPPSPSTPEDDDWLFPYFILMPAE
ncbi:MAG: hypothetical protein VX589_04410 [Myxococcota bacterium]|nr:hypothetical protein [Myxococcota bacterium]